MRESVAVQVPPKKSVYTKRFNPLGPLRQVQYGFGGNEYGESTSPAVFHVGYT